MIQAAEGYVGHDAEMVKVRLHSICFTVNGSLCVSALASNSGDLLPLSDSRYQMWTCQ